MALVVEDGTGKSDADSYLSLADANTYDTNYVASAAWAAATDPEKEVALRQAALNIDAMEQGDWRGQRANEDQALAWPRSSAYDDDDYLIADNVLPTALQHAAAEVAIRNVTEDILADPDEAGTIKKETDKVGPVTTSVEYTGGKSSVKSFPKVTSLLAGLVDGSDDVIRG